jgi:hypothetical protein
VFSSNHFWNNPLSKGAHEQQAADCFQGFEREAGPILCQPWKTAKAISKPQIAHEGKAKRDEKAEHT